MPEADVLVIGSGIAGLSFALRTARSLPHATITVVSKRKLTESNTRYAQGGIAVVSDLVNDSFKSHIEDTLLAGDGLCDNEVVEFVVREAPERLKELIAWGVDFDKNADGGYHLGREGGHCHNRILHKGDFTGREIENCLIRQVLNQRNIRILEHHFAIDLISDGSRCHGAFILDVKKGVTLSARASVTMIASGGLGQVYSNTTNPTIATGDGIAMAYRAGVSVRDLEFIQFHPTALYEEHQNSPFLISEAVRGSGAYLRNKHGERFMAAYDRHGELASRDIVSRAIQCEMKSHRTKYVFLDCRHLDKSRFILQFPTIFDKLDSLGLDIKKDLVPVLPSAHYSCGGICTDYHGNTSLTGLYACGEAACTGLHGANRLASNSLLEALVFSQRACADLITKMKELEPPTQISHHMSVWCSQYPKEIIKQQREVIQRIMSSIAIQTRDTELYSPSRQLDEVEQAFTLCSRGVISPEQLEFQNILIVAKLIIKASIKRSLSKGVFYKEKDGILA